MTRCIWIVQDEYEFLVCEGAAGEIATAHSGYRDAHAAKVACERLALKSNPKAVYGTIAPPAAIRDYLTAEPYEPDRVLVDGWSWIEPESAKK